MAIRDDNEVLKGEVKRYWDSHPCGTQFTSLEWGSKTFFDEVERFRYQTQPFMHRLMEFNSFQGKRLLEIGCGMGTDLLQFARGGALVTGVDLSPRSVELMKNRFALYGHAVHAQVADAENLPFDDNSYDVIYSFGVLHHTPNMQRAIGEIYRVLRPGGRIIIMLYDKRSLHVYLGTPLYWLTSKARHRARQMSLTEDWVRVYDGTDNPLGKAYTRGEVRHLFRDFNNLQITVCDPYRRKYPKMVNMINQQLFARWLGFWMVIKGEK